MRTDSSLSLSLSFSPSQLHLFCYFRLVLYIVPFVLPLWFGSRVHGCALFHSFLFMSLGFIRSFDVYQFSSISYTRDKYTYKHTHQEWIHWENIRGRLAADNEIFQRCFAFVLCSWQRLKWRSSVTVTHKEYRVRCSWRLFVPWFCVFGRLQNL